MFSPLDEEKKLREELVALNTAMPPIDTSKPVMEPQITDLDTGVVTPPQPAPVEGTLAGPLATPGVPAPTIQANPEAQAGVEGLRQKAIEILARRLSGDSPAAAPSTPTGPDRSQILQQILSQMASKSGGGMQDSLDKARAMIYQAFARQAIPPALIAGGGNAKAGANPLDALRLQMQVEDADFRRQKQAQDAATEAAGADLDLVGKATALANSVTNANSAAYQQALGPQKQSNFEAGYDQRERQMGDIQNRFEATQGIKLGERVARLAPAKQNLDVIEHLLPLVQSSKDFGDYAKYVWSKVARKDPTGLLVNFSDPQLNLFNSAVDSYIDLVARDRTGAQINESEAAMLRNMFMNGVLAGPAGLQQVIPFFKSLLQAKVDAESAGYDIAVPGLLQKIDARSRFPLFTATSGDLTPSIPSKPGPSYAPPSPAASIKDRIKNLP